MPGQHLFEYAIIRVVPKVEREEFLNVGVIVYCQKLQYLNSRFELRADRFLSWCDTLDMDEVRQHLDAMHRICKGEKNSGPIGELDLASRFRWLTATRSTIVQSSKVHPGLCDDPEEMLIRLFTQQVL